MSFGSSAQTTIASARRPQCTGLDRRELGRGYGEEEYEEFWAVANRGEEGREGGGCARRPELDAHQELDRDRRAVEYMMACEGMDEIEHARKEELDRLSALHKEVYLHE